MTSLFASYVPLSFPIGVSNANDRNAFLLLSFPICYVSKYANIRILLFLSNFILGIADCRSWQNMVGVFVSLYVWGYPLTEVTGGIWVNHNCSSGPCIAFFQVAVRKDYAVIVDSALLGCSNDWLYILKGYLLTQIPGKVLADSVGTSMSARVFSG